MGFSNRWGSSRLKIYTVRLRTSWLKRRTAILSGISVIALATLLGLVVGNFISLGEVIKTNNQLAEDIKQLAEDNREVSQMQHDTLFHQVECLAEVSLVAARGNDVTITDLEKCEYRATPKAKEQAEVIIVPQVIREFRTETRTETITEPAPQEQPGKGKKK